MRSVILTSLLPQNSDSMVNELELAEALSTSVVPSPEVVGKTRTMLKEKYGHAPRILDIFGGGGTIALEAGRIGCEAHSLEINPLAHFIQKALLEFSQTRKDMPELVDKYGKKVLDKLKIETAQLYRRGSLGNPFQQNIAFLWGRTINCSNPSCNKTISLSGNWLVSKKPKKRVLLTEAADKESGTYERQLHFDFQGEPKAENWKPAKGITCPFCGRIHSRKEFQQLTMRQGPGDELLCVRMAQGTSKSYALPEPVEDFCPPNEKLDEYIIRDLNQMSSGLPSCELPRWSGLVNPPLYGARTYADLFNRRQLSVLLKMVRSLRELTDELRESGFSNAEMLSIISMLSAFVDQLVDWNCRLSMWIEENQQVGRALSGPGIPMLWRYAEIDPFLQGPANLYDKLNRMTSALRFVPQFASPNIARRGSATSLPYETGFFDAIVTDPAYGDNIFYSSLSQCIYVWKRMLLKDLLPDIFGEPCVPLKDEIVAPVYRLPFADAMKVYEQGLTSALREASRVLKPDGVLSLFFAHSTEEAWELIIRAFRSAGLRIVTFWPMLLERHARPRGINSKAVNVSVVIVGRHALDMTEHRSWVEVENEIDTLVSSLSQTLKTHRWNDEDVALASFIKAVGVVARFDEIVDQDKTLSLKESISRCAHLIEKLFPTLSLRNRKNPSRSELKN